MFEKIYRKHPNSWLLLIGDGPLLQEIQNTVTKLDLGDRVIFTGLQKDVVPYYCTMDVLLLPSTREAFTMTLIEAQYNGLQCIVSDAVPKEAAITDSVYPLSINDVSCWVNKIDSLGPVRNDEASLIKSSQFNINQCYKMLESLYQIP